MKHDERKRDSQTPSCPVKRRQVSQGDDEEFIGNPEHLLRRYDQYWHHLRHVENARDRFLQISIAIIAAILVFFQYADPSLHAPILAFILVVSLLGFHVVFAITKPFFRYSEVVHKIEWILEIQHPGKEEIREGTKNKPKSFFKIHLMFYATSFSFVAGFIAFELAVDFTAHLRLAAFLLVTCLSYAGLFIWYRTIINKYFASFKDWIDKEFG